MKYQIQYRGNWAGSSSSRWKPAIAGTLNSTGTSDDVASTFESMDAAYDVLENVVCVELDALDAAGEFEDSSPEFRIIAVDWLAS